MKYQVGQVYAMQNLMRNEQFRYQNPEHIATYFHAEIDAIMTSRQFQHDA